MQIATGQHNHWNGLHQPLRPSLYTDSQWESVGCPISKADGTSTLGLRYGGEVDNFSMASILLDTEVCPQSMLTVYRDADKAIAGTGS